MENLALNKNEPGIHKKTPSPGEFFEQAYGRKVLVKLLNNWEYRGNLICLDGSMNLVLQHCEEIINNKVTNKYTEIYIRGNNGKEYL
jgi:U6 snRNA-associated Sm-like protein LSm6